MARIHDLRVLPKVRDSGSFLYLERGRLEQADTSVQFVSEYGNVAIPVANLSLLLLGPGTTVTHRAVVNATECGCTVAWSGEDGVRLYAAGLGDTRSSANLLRQATAYSDPDLRMDVVRAMYEFRFHESVPESFSLRQIRGREGARVRDIYRSWAKSTGVEWSGRRYRADDWAFADPINRALSSATACLYGICHAAIVSTGFSPGIGFVHTGKSLSFVYDVADMYKMEVAVPAAFKAVKSGQVDVERVARKQLRDEFHNLGLLRTIVKDVTSLFDSVMKPVSVSRTASTQDDGQLFDATLDESTFTPADLWDPEGHVEGGLSHWSEGGVQRDWREGVDGADSSDR